MPSRAAKQPTPTGCNALQVLRAPLRKTSLRSERGDAVMSDEMPSRNDDALCVVSYSMKWLTTLPKLRSLT